MSERNTYKIHEVRKQQFFQIPKQLLLNTYYKDLSSDAMLLYGILQDRMELSRTNNWVNKDGEIYIIFTRDNARDILDISSKSTITKIFNELNDKKLIYEERQGLNKPNIIYIGKIDYKKGINLDMSGKYKKCTSESTDSVLQEVQKSYASNTDYSNTDLSNKEQKGVAEKSNTYYLNSFLKELGVEIDINIKEAINYFLYKYKQQREEEHPRLKFEQWDNIVYQLSFIYDEFDSKQVKDNELTFIDEYKPMIDKYFNTKFQKECDYRLNHFISNGVLRNKFYDIGGSF